MKWLLSILIVCSTLYAKAATLMVEDRDHYELDNYYEYMDSTPHVIDDGNEDAQSHWVKLQIKNHSNEKKSYFLFTENRILYHIEFYLVKGGKVVDSLEDGFKAKTINRQGKSSHMLFPIPLEAQEEVEVYYRILNFNNVSIPFKLVDNRYLLDFHKSYNMLQGFFFGMMFILFLYNLLLYFAVRYRPYLYYALYIFSIFFYFFTLFGFLYRYVSNSNMVWYLTLFSAVAGFTLATLFFIKTILNFKSELPKVDRILNYIAIILTVVQILVMGSIVYGSFLVTEIFFNTFLVFASIFVLLTLLSIYSLAYRNRDLIVNTYAIIWTVIAFFSLLLPMYYLHFLPYDIPVNYLFQLTMIVDVLFFSIVLALKVKVLRKERLEKEKLLIEQNKLASMGEMISSIAHQWRQPLSEINGIVLNMDMDYKKKRLNQDRFTTYLNDLESTTAYLSTTISDFMNFFSSDKKLEVFGTVELMKDCLKLTTISIGDDIAVEYVEEHNMLIEGYKSELIQVLLIAMHNAADACRINQVQDPKITLTTMPLEGRSVLIRIEDNGGGVSKGIAKKIFDPYFTTKHEFKGTGLGLYILKMIVEKSMQGSTRIFNGDLGLVCEIIIPVNLINKQ